MSEELTPMDRMELWMSALNEAITNGTENTFMPYNRYELWMKNLCEAILAKDPADPDVVEAFVNDWLDAHPEATTTVEDGAVSTAKLADGAVTDAKLSASGVKSRVKSDELLTAPDLMSQFVLGKGWSGSVGATASLTNSTYRCSNTEPFDLGNSECYLNVGSGYRISYRTLDAQKKVLADSGWINNNKKFVAENGKLYAFTGGKLSDASCTLSEFTTNIKVLAYSPLVSKAKSVDSCGVHPTYESESGKYVNTSNGTIASGSAYTLYTYPVYGLSQVKINPFVKSSYMGYRFCDKSKALLGTSYGAFASAGENTIAVPEGAYYVQFASNNSASTTEITAEWCKLLANKADTDAAEDRIAALEGNSTIQTIKTVSYGSMDKTNTGILKNDGTVATYTNCYVSDYMPCEPEGTVSCLLSYIYGNYVAVAFYNENKTYISGVTADSGSSGSFTKADKTVTAPNGAKYLRFTMYKNDITGLDKDDQFITYTSFDTVKDVVGSIISDSGVSPWNGKRWCAFGTSLTDTTYMNTETNEVTGKYVPFLAEYSGLVVTNRGIAGGTLGTGGIHGGTSTILNAILESEDLDNFDLITLEGFVNDFACAVTIGDVGDTENTTLCGALHQAISYMLQNSHAEIVLITETTGKEYTLSDETTVNYNILKKNSLDLYQEQYNDAIIKMGKYYGVHVIEAGEKSQINQYHPEYIIDQIHHTTLGGEQYAKTIWEELKNIAPAKVSED